MAIDPATGYFHRMRSLVSFAFLLPVLHTLIRQQAEAEAAARAEFDRAAAEAVARGEGPPKMLVALGYAGWGPGQLEDEISRNAWLTLPADAEVIFDTPVELRLSRAFGLLGIDPVFLSTSAGHA